MKKIFLFAAAAALLTACSSEELSNQEVAQQSDNTPVAFSIYTPRSVTRAGLPSEITTTSLKTGAHKDAGFGVFAYYTDGALYADANTFPNFMYNQQVKWDGSVWKYEPVKYWPNEYGQSATSDDIDRVTFFAYAPWTQVVPSTGVPSPVKEDEKNITGMTKNTATGDPIIKYVVDTDPTTSVDLLWGVFAGQSNVVTSWGGDATSTMKPGLPFIDQLKPKDPLAATGTGDNKIRFNLCHALSKLLVTIDYIDDVVTPAPDNIPATTPAAAGKIEDSRETKIFVREVNIGGFMMKGALNLNNDKTTTMGTSAEIIGKPNWKSYDGLSDLEYEETIFKDGRIDGREGTTDGEASSEKYLGLNPNIIQKTPYETEVDASGKTLFTTAWNTANPGVKSTPVNLFAKWNSTSNQYEPAPADGAIFVIPMEKPIDVSIIYDVETVNPKLAGKLSDNLTPGKSIENKIYKKSNEIFPAETKMEAGKFYTLRIHIGMTSVKVEASVTDWDDQAGKIVNLPANN